MLGTREQEHPDAPKGCFSFPMTDILTVLVDFDIRPYTHILPSLEKALITTADLLSLEPLDVAKRAQVPAGEVRKLVDAVLDGLHGAVGRSRQVYGQDVGGPVDLSEDRPPGRISTLDRSLDASLNGGVAPGYLTEIVGESAVGKTQSLLTLLLSVQLPPPYGLGKPALYISTEAPLQTTRLAQILKTNPGLTSLPESERPSLSRIQSTHIHDVEAQEHILRYQVPVAIKKQNIGLLVIDSIAANYRAEFDKSKARKGAESFAKRSNQLAQLGALLRDIARTHNVAVVMANQVADRFTLVEGSGYAHNSTSQNTTQRSRPASPPQQQTSRSAAMSQPVPSSGVPLTPAQLLSTDDPLALDHQQRFFTGWGDDPEASNFKTPSLGLTWTNQLGARIALLKEPVYEERAYAPGEDRNVSGWNRKAKVVFSAWGPEKDTGFEIWEGGVRGVKEPP
ncbi:DNA repair protein rhp57 [Saxophila tyrrhenica]|uniref:DNA repair protein rhp57 n=1 Tax=Saxophila tyrrhenica TaxID=1690608 RepID=A0AAV9PF78_9PEZI|nr:DNA repair protein rhp57 [Saxophila tyrrhenica]